MQKNDLGNYFKKLAFTAVLSNAVKEDPLVVSKCFKRASDEIKDIDANLGKFFLSTSQKYASKKSFDEYTEDDVSLVYDCADDVLSFINEQQSSSNKETVKTAAPVFISGLAAHGGELIADAAKASAAIPIYVGDVAGKGIEAAQRDLVSDEAYIEKSKARANMYRIMTERLKQKIKLKYGIDVDDL